MTELQIKDIDVESIPWEHQSVTEEYSGVKLTHLPTGTTFTADKEQSRLANLQIAFQMLRIELDDQRRLW